MVLGGVIHEEEVREGRRPSWYWAITSRDELLQVIPMIRPWMVTKAKEADVLLGFLQSAVNQQGRKFNQAEKAERLRVYWKLRELKRYGKEKVDRKRNRTSRGAD
jgi:hypothetical protein